MKGIQTLIDNYHFAQEELKRKLSAAMTHIPHGPCRTCPAHQRDACRDMHIACEAFRMFVIYEKKVRWVQKSRKPNARIYREIFWGLPPKKSPKDDADEWNASLQKHRAFG